MSFPHKLGQDCGTLVRRTPRQRHRKADERGTALIEFAFSMVVTFVLIFGMIDFARGLYSYHFVSNAAREATRFASVRGALCSGSVSPCPADAADIETYVMQIVPQGIDPTQVTITPRWPTRNYPPVCTATPGYPGCPVEVKVSYNFSYIFPAAFYNLAPVSYGATSFTMSSTSQMIISR